MAIELESQNREAILNELKAYFTEHFDEHLSDFRSAHLLDFFLNKLGPPVYNQAIQDARKFMQHHLDDLDTEFYQPE